MAPVLLSGTVWALFWVPPSEYRLYFSGWTPRPGAVTLDMCVGVSRHMCVRSFAVGYGAGDGKRRGLAAVSLFSLHH